MNILLINLDQCIDRLVQQNEQFQKLGLAFDRLAAVSINEISAETYKRLACNGQRQMKESELACFLSHKKAWQIVIEKNEPHLILEDDAVLVHDLKEILDDIEDKREIDFVNLEVHGRKKMISKDAKFKLSHNYNLFQLYQDRSGTGGYILFPTGAKKLLAYLEKTYPKLADEFIYSCYSLAAYQIEPAALIQSDKADMYGVNVNRSHDSVIGLIKNRPEISLNDSMMVVLKYKKKRVFQQIFLGIRQLMGVLKFKRRYIKLDKERFNLDIKEVDSNA